jgi:hypothetical protein
LLSDFCILDFKFLILAFAHNSFFIYLIALITGANRQYSLACHK